MEKKEIMSNDEKGNYDLDGVSSDGDDVFLSGDNLSAHEPVQNPKKKERKKNLGYTPENKRRRNESA